MAIAVDARTPGAVDQAAAVTASTSMSWSHTLGSLSNGILIVCPQQDAGANSTGVNWDDGGTNQALTRKGSVSQGSCRAEIWYLVGNPHSVTGTKTIKVSWSGSHDGIGGSASYSGVDQSTIFNAASPQTATGASGTNPSLTVTTTNGELAIDSVVRDLTQSNTVDWTVGAGQSAISGGSNTANTGSIDSGVSDEAATGASVAMTWTMPGSFGAWGSVGVSLLVAGAGGGSAVIQAWSMGLMGVQ